MVALGALGLAIAGYLTWVHFSGALALCAGAGGCETVQASRFATVAGVPVALLGLALYLALLVLAAWRTARGPAAPDGVRLALFGLALAGTLYSAYLTYLELFVIGALCPWCVPPPSSSQVSARSRSGTSRPRRPPTRPRPARCTALTSPTVRWTSGGGTALRGAIPDSSGNCRRHQLGGTARARAALSSAG